MHGEREGDKPEAENVRCEEETGFGTFLFICRSSGVHLFFFLFFCCKRNTTIKEKIRDSRDFKDHNGLRKDTLSHSEQRLLQMTVGHGQGSIDESRSKSTTAGPQSEDVNPKFRTKCALNVRKRVQRKSNDYEIRK